MFLLSTIVSLLYLASDVIAVVIVFAAATVAIFVIIFARDVNNFAATPLVSFAAAVDATTAIFVSTFPARVAVVIAAAVVVSIFPARDVVVAAAVVVRAAIYFSRGFVLCVA